MSNYKHWWDVKHWTGPWTREQCWLYYDRQRVILEKFEQVCVRRAKELGIRKGTRFLKCAADSLQKELNPTCQIHNQIAS